MLDEKMKSEEAAHFIMKDILKMDAISSVEKDALKLAIEGIFRAGVLGAMQTVCPPKAGETYRIPRFWVDKDDLTKPF